MPIDQPVIDGECETLWRCAACETLFEEGVADALNGKPRCPQCGLAESHPATVKRAPEIVIRRTTRFR